MKKIYLVYGYFSDIHQNVMLRACSSRKKAEEYKKWLDEHPTKELHSTRIEIETLF